MKVNFIPGTLTIFYIDRTHCKLVPEKRKTGLNYLLKIIKNILLTRIFSADSRRLVTWDTAAESKEFRWEDRASIF